MYIWTSNGNKITGTLQGEYDPTIPGLYPTVNVFQLSRTMLRLHREDNQRLTQYHFEINPLNESPIYQYYYSDPSGDLVIPWHNLINKYPTSISVLVTMYEVGGSTPVDSIGVNLEVFKGIAYSDLNAPKNKDCTDFFALYGHQYIVPPNVILNPDTLGGVTAPGIIFESNYHDYNNNLKWYSLTAGVAAELTPGGSRSNQFTVPYSADGIKLADTTKEKAYQLTKPSYCADVICLRWTSMTGAVRQHFFPIVAFMKGNDKETSLVTPGDGYDVTKAPHNAVRCKIDGLTAWGYYYYMDLLQASDVHGVIRPSTSNWAVEIASAETSVYVDGKATETPQGIGFFSFEFTVKLRHYDTI